MNVKNDHRFELFLDTTNPKNFELGFTDMVELRKSINGIQKRFPSIDCSVVLTRFDELVSSKRKPIGFFAKKIFTESHEHSEKIISVPVKLYEQNTIIKTMPENSDKHDIDGITISTNNDYRGDEKMSNYNKFIERLKLLISKQPDLIITTLSNIFTMRLIGNKTHGDLAEIAISEFINQYMYDYKSEHVGKDLFRSNKREEDILVTEELTAHQIPISLKAYGVGALQLSTDKNSTMFPFLKKIGKNISGSKLTKLWKSKEFGEFENMNILPLIYDEENEQCNIMVFDSSKAKRETKKIEFVPGNGEKGRKHPIYMFLDKNNQYICEVRYGGAEANALQRGLWTSTKHCSQYFNSVTNGWIDYSYNYTLVKLFSHALVSSKRGHEDALEKIKQDIKNLQLEKGNLNV